MQTILKQRGATAYFTVVFLNAFIDLAYKITLQNIVFKVYDGRDQIMLTAILNAMILLPFVLFFLPAARINNAYNKPSVIRYSSFSLVVLMLIAIVCYVTGQFWAAFVLTFVLAVQSTVYSPAKLGYLKTLFGEVHLPSANGMAQVVVVLAILFATVVFSLAFEWQYTWFVDGGVKLLATDKKSAMLQMMVPLATAMLLLSLLQALISRYIVDKPENDLMIPASNDKPFTALSDGDLNQVSRDNGPSIKHHGLIKETRIWGLLKQKSFMIPVAGLALFWTIGQGLLAVFPSYAKSYLGVVNVAVIQTVMACAAVGIVLGAGLAARWRSQAAQLNLAISGIAGLSLGVVLLLSFKAISVIALVYLMLGIASGMLIVPLNSYLQRSTSVRCMGTVIATSNLIQNLAMLTMLAATFCFVYWGLSSFNLIAGMAVFVVIFGVPVIWGIRQLK